MANSTKTNKNRLATTAVAAFLLVGGAGGALAGCGASGEDHAHNADGSHVLGESAQVRPITVKLSDGRTLKVTLSLQLIADPKNQDLVALTKGTSDSASAPANSAETAVIDAANRMFGKSTFDELSKPASKKTMQDDLEVELAALFKGDVTAVYYKSFTLS
jgi:flagellar basal body-associated protein FliL